MHVPIVTGCGFDPHMRKQNIYLHLYFHFFALVLRRGVEFQHAMPPDSGGKWETEYLTIGFPLSTLLCAGYSVKLILKTKGFSHLLVTLKGKLSKGSVGSSE